MRRWLIVGCAAALSACQWIPGAEQHTAQRGKGAAADLMRDPSSAQFRNIKVRPVNDPKVPVNVAVCGEINGKNAHGAYAGFARFIADPIKPEAYLDPQLDVTAEDMNAALAQCEQAVSDARRSGFTDLARFQCDQSHEAISSFKQQSDFDGAWSAICETASAPPT